MSAFRPEHMAVELPGTCIRAECCLIALQPTLHRPAHPFAKASLPPPCTPALFLAERRSMEVLQAMDDLLDTHLRKKFDTAVTNVGRTFDLYGCAARDHAPLFTG